MGAGGPAADAPALAGTEVQSVDGGQAAPPETDAPKLEPEPAAAGGTREEDAEMPDAEPLSAGLDQHMVSGALGAGEIVLQGVAAAAQGAALQQQAPVRQEGPADALCRHMATQPPVLECERTHGDCARMHAS